MSNRLAPRRVERHLAERAHAEGRRARDGAVEAPALTPAARNGKLISLDVRNNDSGLHVKLGDSSLTISGTARGIESRGSGGRNGDGFTYISNAGDDYLNTEQFGGNIGFGFDHDRMPEFDTSRGYTEKNRWFSAHNVSIGTKRGQTAEQVANALAAKVEGDYQTKVTKHFDGSATLELIRGE